jgi:hypothetical protein
MATQSAKNKDSAKARWLAEGVAIPHDTDDLRLAIKREVWTRGLTITALAEKLDICQEYLERCLRRGPYSKRMYPGMLNRIIEAVHVTPCVAKRLHLLAAREAGWNV